MSKLHSPLDAVGSDTTGISLSRLAWYVVALLWPVAMLNYLDRQMLATMKSSMVSDIVTSQGTPLTNEQWGIVLASFKWVYAFLSPLAGFVGDRFSRRHVICVSLLAWSVATWATGYVRTYEQLLFARALMGVAEAFYFPTALALITDYHLGGTRSIAVGIHQTAIYCGAIIGGCAGFVADDPSLGWRSAFTAFGIVGIVYSVPLFWQLQNPPRAKRTGDHEPASQGSVATDLLRNPAFGLLVLYFTLPALAGWVIRDWGPTIVKERFHLDQGTAGVLAVVSVQIAALFGAALGGLGADRLMQRTIRGRIFVSALGMLLFLPALFGIGAAGSLVLAIACFILFGIGWGCFDCNNMPILCQIVRPRFRATGFGIMNLVSISCGGLADWRFGKLRDMGVADSLIFGVFALIALISVVVVLLIKPREGLQEDGAVLH